MIILMLNDVMNVMRMRLENDFFSRLLSLSPSFSRFVQWLVASAFTARNIKRHRYQYSVACQCMLLCLCVCAQYRNISISCPMDKLHYACSVVDK